MHALKLGRDGQYLYESVCRERDIDHDHDALLQQQQEKDQQYNAMVKSLKDRVRTQDSFCCS